MAKKLKASGESPRKPQSDGSKANGSADQPTAKVKKSDTTATDTPIASKTGSTGVAASEGIAAGTSQVTSRKGMRAQVEDVEED